jgi:hypothetical protein
MQAAFNMPPAFNTARKEDEDDCHRQHIPHRAVTDTLS